MINWDKIKHFDPSEFDDPQFPGSGHRIDGVLLMQMEKLRHETGWPIVIHTQQGGAIDVNGNHGHAVTSYHLKAMGSKAVDWHFKTDASVRLQVRAVLQMGFGGTGIYYDWGVPVGFHTDVRPHEKYQVWTREKGKYIYWVKE